jgi:hypothetical protein
VNAPALRVFIEVGRPAWAKRGGLQLSISKRDETGLGSGYRIAGPKFDGTGETLLSAELSREDAAEIRRYLDAVYPPGAAPAELPEARRASCGHPADEDGECSCSYWPERAPGVTS